IDLVRAEYRPHLVVEHLCRRARQRTKSCLLEPQEKFIDRQAERLCALVHLQGGEGMDMHTRYRLAHCAADVDVGGAGEVGMDPALHADFGCTALPRFTCARRDFLERQIVWPSAQVLAHLAFRESAELAFERADIGVIYVARYDVRDDVAAHVAPQ